MRHLYFCVYAWLSTMCDEHFTGPSIPTLPLRHPHQYLSWSIRLENRTQASTQYGSGWRECTSVLAGTEQA